MISRDDSILAFLQEDVQSISLGSWVAHLKARQEQLFLAENPNISKLGQRRILASNSLLRSQPDRERWDKSNALISEWIHADSPFSLDALTALNSTLTGTQSLLRSQPVFGCQDEYLSPDWLPLAILLLSERLPLIEEPLIKAAWLYIWVINVHPFADGNGRTARLAADWQLISEGYPPLCFVSNVQSHVAYAQAERFGSLEDSVGKCLAAIDHSYDLIF